MEAKRLTVLQLFECHKDAADWRWVQGLPVPPWHGDSLPAGNYMKYFPFPAHNLSPSNQLWSILIDAMDTWIVVKVSLKKKIIWSCCFFSFKLRCLCCFFFCLFASICLYVYYSDIHELAWCLNLKIYTLKMYSAIFFTQILYTFTHF